MSSVAPAQVVINRATAVQAGVRVEELTIAWMLVEAALSIYAGIVARSVVLTAFGLDSVIELVTGTVLLWRLLTETDGRDLAGVDRAETKAAWVTGISLALLCMYIAVTACFALVTHTQPGRSLLGIAVALAAVIGMPILAGRKRQIASQLSSAALRGDAACSITCAYMAGALLTGLCLNAILGWWWADSLAAIALLYWLIAETREALHGAMSGHGGCNCASDQ